MIRRGGYGEVWLARNELGQARAVKLVHRSMFDDDRPYSREWEGVVKYEPISRRHENLISILHVGKNDEEGYFYYVMELADNADPEMAYIGLEAKKSNENNIVFGPDKIELTPEQTKAALNYEINLSSYKPNSLKESIETKAPFPTSEIISIIEPLIEALAFLHENDLVHRDIKPSNVVYYNGNPCLTDPGLIAIKDSNLSLVGTLGYIAPEGPGRASGDVFSMGILLYEMLTGLDPQSFPSLPDELLSKNCDKNVIALNQVSLRACDSNHLRRYQNAEEMLEDVKQISSGKSGLNKKTYISKALYPFLYITLFSLITWFITLTIRVDTSSDTKWDFEYVYKNIYASNSLIYVYERKNIQQIKEWQDPPVTYWAPITNGLVGKLTYRFKFLKPTRDLYLQANCTAWNFEIEPGSNSKAKGSYAILGSIDGTNWVDLINRLEPEIIWGRDENEMNYKQVLPSALTGTKQLWVQIQLLSTNMMGESNFSPVQHSRSDDFEHDLFIVKAKY